MKQLDEVVDGTSLNTSAERIQCPPNKKWRLCRSNSSQVLFYSLPDQQVIQRIHLSSSRGTATPGLENDREIESRGEGTEDSKKVPGRTSIRIQSRSTVHDKTVREGGRERYPSKSAAAMRHDRIELKLEALEESWPVLPAGGRASERADLQSKTVTTKTTSPISSRKCTAAG